MSVLFSQDWMQAFGNAWNKDAKMVETLSKADFTTIIGFGFTNEDKPRGAIEVLQGKVAACGSYAGQPLVWDLRASISDWEEWLTKGFGLAKLGVAVSSGRLKFNSGDYRQMIRKPELASPFLHHFEIMSGIPTEFRMSE